MNGINQPSQRTPRGTLISAGICACALISGVAVAHSVTTYPRTDDAEVTANFIGIAPLVEGPVSELAVHDNELVKKGTLLYKIDDRPYLYALQNALAAQEQLEGLIENESRQISSQVSHVDVTTAATQAALANEARADNEIQASEAAISEAEAAVTQARADSEYASGNLHRIEPLLAKGFVTTDDVHRARTLADAKSAAVQRSDSQLSLAKARLLVATAARQQAVAQKTQTEAQVNESKHSVLVLAPLVAQRESRAAAVRLARYNYEQCRVVAPFDALVTNLTISEGQYAKVGQQLFTLIDSRTWWTLANFRESQLSRITPGKSVDVYLMSDSKTRLHGTVESVGHGVTPDPDVVGKLASGLPDVQRTLNWVRLASRYPVRIRIIDPPPSVMRVGQVANVIVR